mgnify:CR=1 FL=1
MALAKSNMARVNAILKNSNYIGWLIANGQAEQKRQFCRHDLAHALNVARIAYSLWLEAGGNPVAKDIVYSAALLHDIGRWLEYADDSGETDHAVESAKLAHGILLEVGYHPDVAAEIEKAIANHRNADTQGLSQVLYKADKLSRECFFCPALQECHRKEKNTDILY